MTHPSRILEQLGATGPTGRTATRARRWFLEHGLPDPHAEQWRYTPLDQIADALADITAAPHRPLEPHLLDSLAGHHAAIRLVFVNGHFDAGLSDRRPLGPGLWCGSSSELAEPIADRYELIPDDPRDAFHALNLANTHDIAIVLADRDTAPGRPIHILHVAVGDEHLAMAHPRTIIHANARSDIEVIETFTGIGAAVTNADTTIRLGAEAVVRHHRIQTEATDAIHVGHTAAHLARDSQLRSTSVMAGGRIARHAGTVRLYGPRAHAELTGLHHLTDQQRHVTELTVDHASSNGTTSQRYVGIVGGRARSSFGGHVIVRDGTIGNDAYQLNQNLLLTPTAKADTRPWLEINADDVRCNHGATVGRLDDDALHYLRTRGIPDVRARQLLVEAFARRILEPIAPRSLRDHLEATLAGIGTT